MIAVEEHRTRGRETCKAISFVIRSERIGVIGGSFGEEKYMLKVLRPVSQRILRKGPLCENKCSLPSRANL